MEWEVYRGVSGLKSPFASEPAPHPQWAGYSMPVFAVAAPARGERIGLDCYLGIITPSHSRMYFTVNLPGPEFHSLQGTD